LASSSALSGGFVVELEHQMQQFEEQRGAAFPETTEIGQGRQPGGKGRSEQHRQEHCLRLLVAIASYGNKNIAFLKRIIGTYQRMSIDVTIFVLSEAAKDLGPDVNVMVGLPSKNPWSLPFAHKELFAKNVERYDLFVYSEDDMEVTEENIQAFLQVTPALDDDEIAGFIRYEIDPSGSWSLPDVHGIYHWKPETVKSRGSYTVAEFSNEHAAFYILTQSQLRRAIASGGFLREPYESRHDMLCSAATDPYTSCGFRKVICISALKKFLIHHLPNRYVGQLGLQITSCAEQIQTLLDIQRGTHPGISLCETESPILHGRWSKSYYENPCHELLRLVPPHAKTILSVGCGSGATEVELRRRGAEVTALPLDSVIGATAAQLGIEVIYGTLEECFAKLGSRKFQCVLITNLLHLLPAPFRLLDESAGILDAGGTLLISGANFDYLPTLVRRKLRLGEYQKLSSFAESGIRVLGARAVVRQLKRAGLRVSSTQWNNSAPLTNKNSIRQRLGRWLMTDWIVQAEKGLPRSGHLARNAE
jgi:2-polyprenyl-3-methyl-5-hydroxy-6-metoxy-1,4-benzoquinol methylase